MLILIVSVLSVTNAAENLWGTESGKEGEDDGGQKVNVRFISGAGKFFEVDTSDL